MSLRAAATPSVSIFQAACSVISRAACISASESAIQFWTVWCLASTEPCAVAVQRALAEHVERPAGDARASACSGGCGPGTAAAGRSGSRRPRRRAAPRRGRARPRRGSRRGCRSARSSRRGAPSSATSRTTSDARGVGVDDEHRGALVRPGVGVGDRHHDQEVGDRAVGGEPLVAVDHPVVAVADRPGRSSVGSEPAVSGSVMLNADFRSPASSGCR